MSRKDLHEWWREAVIYQIYPRSFRDQNGDGLGDIIGITQQLDYLAELGVDAVWISPHYPSPQVDAGYDVSNYFDINPEYGTLADFDDLIAAAHARNIKVIIDVVPNHCSSQHEWFKAALAAPANSPERERFIFRYSENGAPNNWGSMFGGSAWQEVSELSGKAEDKNWYYLHIFAPEQPDLNWNNPEIHEMFKDYFRFWCDRGVDGFRVDVAHGLVKAAGLPDDEIGPDRWAYFSTHPQLGESGPFFDQDGVHEIYREWRKVLNEYGSDRMMVAEAFVHPAERLAKYVREEEMSQAFHFDYLKCGWKPRQLRQIMNDTMAAMSKVGAPVTWVLSNHDVVRHSTRFAYPPEHNTSMGIGPSDPQPDRALGLRRAKAASMFTFALPGSMYMFQGEELGLPDYTEMPDDARQDPTWFRTGKKVRGRDGCRVPLPWQAQGENFGFGAGKPWLPQPEYWKEYAVDRQQQDPDSTLKFYQQMIALRAKYALGRGDFAWLDLELPEEIAEEVLAFSNGELKVIFNMSGQNITLPVLGNIILASNAQTKVEADELALPADSCVYLA